MMKTEGEEISINLETKVLPQPPPTLLDTSSSVTLIKDKKCIHCSVPLTNHDNNEELEESPNMQVLDPFPPKTGQWLTKALSLIFKLNYLNAFDNFKGGHQGKEEKNDIELCHNCNHYLTCLYQQYMDFVELGKIDSYLSKKLAQLDELIDHHEKKSINCDLIKKTIRKQEDGDNNNETPSSSNVANSKSSLILVEKPSPPSKRNKRKTTVNTKFSQEPRIILRRLPERYTKSTTVTLDSESDVDDYEDNSADYIPSDNPDDDDDDDDDEPMDCRLLPEIILKMEQDARNAENDEDFNFLYFGSKSSQQSSANYNEKTVSGVDSSKPRRKSTLSSRKRKSSEEDEEDEEDEELTPVKKRERTSVKKEASSRQKKKVGRKKKENVTTVNKSTKKSPLKKVKELLAPGKGKRENKRKTKHYLTKKTKYPNPCWYCKRGDFATPEECVEHTKLEHLSAITAPDPRVCTRCAKICINDNSYTLHMKRCELIPSGICLPKQFQCPECSKSFGLENSLKNHLLSHSNDRPYLCDECPYAAKSAAVLKGHKVNKHSVEGTEQKVQCDVCQTLVKNLHLHKINMHTVEGYQKYRERQTIILAKQKAERMIKSVTLSTICSDCNVDFFSRLALINHRRTSHGDNMGKAYICHLCGNSFTAQRSLKLHTQRVHSDERKFICEHCGKAFKVNYNLKAHVEQTHTEEGRLKYNAQMRERNRRMKVRARQLENVKQQQQQQQQIRIEGIPPGPTTSFADFWQNRDGSSNNNF